MHVIDYQLEFPYIRANIELTTSDRWKFVKDPSVSTNKKDIDLTEGHMMKTIRKYQINSRFALLKHMADCYKGERGRDLPKSHLTTPDGELLYY